MFRQWLATHRSLVAGATSGTVIAALVATVAIVSTGYTTQRLDLSDGGVWVANSQAQALGRANTEVLELNAVVEAESTDIEVVQSGSVVLLVDRAGSTIGIVDPATALVVDTVALPPRTPEVFIAGDRVVILEKATGELWIVPFADLASFDAESSPSLSLGAGAVVSVDPAGLLFAYAPSTGLVYRVNAVRSDAVEATTALATDEARDLSITSVAGRWMVLDRQLGRVWSEASTVDISAELGTTSDVVLQRPSLTGDRVLVSFLGGLIAVPLGGGPVARVLENQSGTPAEPVVVAGCQFAGWSTGIVWRECVGDGPATTQSLESMPVSPRLAFQVNGDRVLLGDNRGGASWAVQRAGELIDNWDDLIRTTDEDPEVEQNDEEVPPEIEKTQLPPVAVDDLFGARPGRATVLPVLLNDYDPNGDVLIVSEFTPVDPALGRLDLINDRQALQLTLLESATGPLTFDYTITDGRGGSATATVTVEVRSPQENSPPVQVRSTTVMVESGKRVTSQVLGDWIDPDGDAFYLTSASVAAPDTVSHKPSGTLSFADSGQGGDLKTIAIAVSDGADEAAGSVSVQVKPTGEVEIVADPFVVLVPAGREIEIDPLAHVRGGSGQIRLNSVPAKPDVTLVASYETGTFRFTSDAVRSHYLEYVVTDGIHTVTGLIRVDVVEPPNANTAPITIPKTVFVQTLRNERIDVAGTDRDPAGGVLLVTGIMNLPSNSGVQAEVIEQRIVRVSLVAPLDTGPVTFNYRISNGLAEAEGVITVVEIPAPTRVQPPIAQDDAISVRVGQAIDIPVLANDEHPDGFDLTLDPRLERALPDGAGLLFASGRVLRYLAPTTPGNFTASYRVTGPDGQAATAVVRIAVREADAATNNAPVPPTVTARVLAGETVRIAIPLTGTDPDGDSVQLLGLASNPEMGSVPQIDGDTIVYEAGQYSAGTDTFNYTVIDSLGARATGTVRVGISPRLEGARNPVAILDEVTVRPGVTVWVRALENDSDPDGSPLRIVSAVPNDEVTTAVVEGTVVQITPPRAPGTYGVIYAIENDSGGTSQNFIRVTVSPDAPLAFPIASDSVLGLSDILDRDRVVVDVLANVFFADGDPRSLGLSVYPGYGDVATVTSTKRIEVTIGDASQIIPFKVTHPDDPTVFGYAFIRVPGRDDALPQLDRRAPGLTVVSGDRLLVDINDYVIAVGGKQVRLTDSSSVRATHSDGSALVVDDDTLAFTSAERYFGPASISFEVTDGTSANDPNGRTAILVLPIVVLPRDNQPPVFGGAAISFEPGQEKVIDLLKLTNYPYPDDLDELTYSLIGAAPSGFTLALNGSALTIRSDASALKGTMASIAVGVRDAVAEGTQGRIELTVVPSTRPLTKPAPDTAVVARGGTTVVDVLANDQATNPFPGTQLTVTSIRGVDGASLPPGVQIQPSADRRTLTVTVAASAQAADISLQYQVADATKDVDRMVWGTVTVSIQDRPDPVSALSATGFADRELTMRWNAGAFNNSPITNYKVTTQTPSGSPIATTNCSGTTCVIPTPGNGSNHAVRVSVVASNAIGDSDPVVLADPVWSDVVPAAPTGLSSTPVLAGNGLILTWNAVATPGGGTAVQNYVVTVGGVSAELAASSCGATCTLTVAHPSLTNGTAVEYRVSARNDAYGALASWNTASQVGTPAGPPITTALVPLAVASNTTTISLDWAGVFSDNGRPISGYTAVAYTTGTAPTCAAPAPSGSISIQTSGTSAQFSSLAPNAEYRFIVLATNSQGCGATTFVTSHTPPPVITALTFAGPAANGSAFDFVLTGGSMGSEALTGDYTVIYQLSGGSVIGGERGPVSVGSFLTADGSQYGQSISVQARACRTYNSVPVCQTQLSAPIAVGGVPVDPRAAGVHFVSDGDPANHNGVFTWDALPAGGYQSVQVACGPAAGAGTFVDGATVTSCAAAVSLLDTPWLTVRVTANGGQQYDFSYNGYDYD